MTEATHILRHDVTKLDTTRLVISGLLAALCILPGAAEGKSRKKMTPLELYRADYLDKAAQSYAVAPDIAKCKAGQLADAEKTAMIATLNDIRRLHGLSPVTYDTAFDDQQMQAALIMAANGRLDHNPTADWKCYSEKGAVGAITSNLSGGMISPTLRYDSAVDTVIGWVIDRRNIKGGVGHRKWLLNPYMTSVTYGRVAGPLGKDMLTGGAAIRISNGTPLYDYTDQSDVPFQPVKIIAYPYSDYPAKYYADGALMSVALQLNSNNRLNSGVDFSATKVHLSENGGDDIPVTDMVYDSMFTGLPITLQFNPGALKRDVPYNVRLEGVVINGAATDLSYTFRLVSEPASASPAG